MTNKKDTDVETILRLAQEYLDGDSKGAAAQAAAVAVMTDGLLDSIGKITAAVDGGGSKEDVRILKGTEEISRIVFDVTGYEPEKVAVVTVLLLTFILHNSTANQATAFVFLNSITEAALALTSDLGTGADEDEN